MAANDRPSQRRRPRRSAEGLPGTVTRDPVAPASGVSAAPVPRILNGTAIVSDDPRSVVDGAIARLGCVPNPVARGLAALDFDSFEGARLAAHHRLALGPPSHRLPLGRPGRTPRRTPLAITRC